MTDNVIGIVSAVIVLMGIYIIAQAVRKRVIVKELYNLQGSYGELVMTSERVQGECDFYKLAVKSQDKELKMVNDLLKELNDERIKQDNKKK